MAHYVNRFRVISYGDLVRVIFEDAITGDDGIVQTQVIMRADDAEALSDLIVETMRQQKAKSG